MTFRDTSDLTPQRSISTLQPGTRSLLICTVVRGGGEGKNSFHTWSKWKKSLRSVRNTCDFTTSLKLQPAASNTLFRLSRT